jgi:hypothetical protein
MFSCDICNYKTKRNYSFERHLTCGRHLININNEINNKNDYNKELKKYNCPTCNKSYLYSSGLSRHLKFHKNEKGELCKEINKDSGTINVTNNNIQTQNIKNIQNNKYINIQVFLNEHCKNAINMSDFINSIEINDESIEKGQTHELSTIISDNIINALNQLSLYERPIHCSDKKRSTLYIKENDKWDKDKEHNRFKNVVDDITYKHFIRFRNWLKEHPDYNNDEKLKEEYMQMIHTFTTDIKEKNEKPYKKILNNVSKEVYYGNNS